MVINNVVEFRQVTDGPQFSHMYHHLSCATEWSCVNNLILFGMFLLRVNSFKEDRFSSFHSIYVQL